MFRETLLWCLHFSAYWNLLGNAVHPLFTRDSAFCDMLAGETSEMITPARQRYGAATNNINIIIAASLPRLVLCSHLAKTQPQRWSSVSFTMSFFSGFLPGIFGRMEDPKEREVKVKSPMVIDEATRKRNRKSVRRTPTLISTQSSVVDADDTVVLKEPPSKRRRGENDQSIPVLKEEAREEEKKDLTCPLAQLPDDVLAHCLSFCSGVEDRFALQCTSKQFRRISNSDEMMIGIQVGGDKKTGLHGIISETDSPESSSCNLLPYARAGNLEAIYMYVLPFYLFIYVSVLINLPDLTLFFSNFYSGLESSRAIATKMWKEASPSCAWLRTRDMYALPMRLDWYYVIPTRARLPPI